MLTEDGVLKITDFGRRRRALGDPADGDRGDPGSPGYIRRAGLGMPRSSARSDIYSLGRHFYHLVTGRLPFEAPTPVAMIVKHMSEPLRRARGQPRVPYPIASAIQKMMAKRPGERFQDYDLSSASWSGRNPRFRPTPPDRAPPVSFRRRSRGAARQVRSCADARGAARSPAPTSDPPGRRVLWMLMCSPPFSEFSSCGSVQAPSPGLPRRPRRTERRRERRRRAGPRAGAPGDPDELHEPARR